VDIPKIQWYPGHIAKAEKKLSEFMEGEIFDEMIENLVIHAQENQLSNI